MTTPRKAAGKRVRCPYHGETEWVPLTNLDACQHCLRKMPGAFKLHSFKELLDKPLPPTRRRKSL